ncbi:Ni/Fe hydrogenase subunit alpha [Desulfocapsa sp. AH-315-G09]|uniref:Ni/Fe hydrogenase subunit alpha n=1 Tax=Desulfotalea psychrophila TaxID=84980 RepID=A0ABS3AU60_9BACT|nr:Ni/Fe hydrogenase subunit alpha [Desulfocapsa sp.]MBN4065240.1 Ni/Fe hydrogenase subunit alpha [Desulfocapsa sp. AH-315-G09]MBN4068055.1 Ni/Fe hydrogenase subunit alpha [Desulfotalea psychrophila]
MQKIVIEPISRIEGEGKITIFVGSDGEVVKARFQMMEFRAFEEFVKGRMIWEMPLITSKICGICPIPQHLAAVKAAEAALGVKGIPDVALLLRKLLLAGGAIQDHALHFLYLAFPDFVFGSDTPPEKRSITGLLEKHPQLVKKAIFLRKCGVRMAEMIGGDSIYPVTAIPGGMTMPLTKDNIQEITALYRKGLDAAQECAELALKVVNSKMKNRFPQNSPSTKFMTLISKNNGFAHYQGDVRVIDEKGNALETFRASDYASFIDEDIERDSWAKFPFLRRSGRHEGVYRVGPLARLNAIEQIETPMAGKWLKQFKAFGDGLPVKDIIYYHLARTIELVYEFEQSLQILEDAGLTDRETRIPVSRQAGEGVGIVEAPRGTLIHHYKCGSRGEVTHANLIVPTTHNNAALQAAVTAVAKKVIKNGAINDAGRQQVEMAVRAYDPCLSCATHSWNASRRLPVEVVREEV